MEITICGAGATFLTSETTTLDVMKTNKMVLSQSGFSLIELLTVIAVIGVLAAMALAYFDSLSEETNKVKDQRNAQNIITAYTTGSAAGVVWPSGDVATKVAAVIVGQTPTDGVFASTMFRSTVTTDAATATYKFIGVRSAGDLFYDPTAGQDPAGH